MRIPQQKQRPPEGQLRFEDQSGADEALGEKESSRQRDAAKSLWTGVDAPSLAWVLQVVTIAVDAMGGDHAPEAIVQGAAEASLVSDATIILIGDVALIKEALDRHEHQSTRIEVVAAEGAIPMDAKPRAALEAMPNASLPMAARLVASDDPPDALVTAGNSGAVILACAQHFERLPGVKRTALCAVIPSERRHGPKDDPFTLLLDVGATLQVDAYDLVSFAAMGSAYASIVSKNPKPTVALLSNGHEANKGTPQVVEAHAILAAQNILQFAGNIEGVDVSRGVADVVVCEGFIGNITLKMLEGVSESVQSLARYAYRSRLDWKIALVLLGGGIRRLKAVTDWQQYGGAPILGFNRLCIKAHGRSGPRAIKNAIRVAERCVRQSLNEKIAEGLKSIQPTDGSR